MPAESRPRPRSSAARGSPWRRPRDAARGFVGTRHQLTDDGQRLLEPTLPVVEEHQRELRVDLRVARIARGLFDHLKTLRLVAAKARHVSDPAHRQRHRRHDVAVGADNQSRILARRVQRQHALVRVVGAARGTERAANASLHCRGVRRLQADGGADVIERADVLWVCRQSALGQFEGACQVPPKRLGIGGWRLLQLEVAARGAAQVLVDRDRPSREDDVQPRRRRSCAVRGRVVGLERQRLVETCHGVRIVQVVGLGERLRSELGRGGRLRAGIDEPHHQ